MCKRVPKDYCFESVALFDALSARLALVPHAKSVAKRIDYKRQHLINPVSITLVIFLGILAYLASLYMPNWLIKQESKRVLNSAGHLFTIHRSRYLASEKQVEGLREQMSRDMRSAGVTDPDMEVYVDIEDDGGVVLGVIYTQKWPMPFELGPAKEAEVAQEYRLGID
jgi:hypothetical protein